MKRAWARECRSGPHNPLSLGPNGPALKSQETKEEASDRSFAHAQESKCSEERKENARSLISWKRFSFHLLSSFLVINVLSLTFELISSFLLRRAQTYCKRNERRQGKESTFSSFLWAIINHRLFPKKQKERKSHMMVDEPKKETENRGFDRREFPSLEWAISFFIAIRQ